MHPDDHVCLCHRVSLHKLRGFIERERPEVASQLSECLGAGTGCGWCVPFLTRLHEMAAAGETPDLAESPEEYAARRIEYKRERAARKAQSLENPPPPPS